MSFVRILLVLLVIVAATVCGRWLGKVIARLDAEDDVEYEKRRDDDLESGGE